MLWPREPVYQGRQLSEWLELHNSANPTEQMAAEAALAQMGESVVPALMRIAQLRDSRLKDWVQKLADRQSVVEIDFTPAFVRRARAERALCTLGPAAHRAVPQLIEMLRAGREGVNAGAILAEIGPPAVQPLMGIIHALTNKSARVSAISALGWLGTNAQPAIPLLLDIAQDTNDAACKASIRALGDIGELKEQFVPVLTNMFWVSFTTLDAAYALSRLKGSGLLPLTVALTNEDQRIRCGAISGLMLVQMELDGRLTGRNRQRMSSLFNLKAINATYSQQVLRVPPELKTILEANRDRNDPELKAASEAALAVMRTWTNSVPSRGRFGRGQRSP